MASRGAPALREEAKPAKVRRLEDAAEQGEQRASPAAEESEAAAQDELGGMRLGHPLVCLEDHEVLRSLLPRLEEIGRSHAGGSHVMLRGFGVAEAQDQEEERKRDFPDQATVDRLLAIARSQVLRLESRATCLLSVRILLSPPGAPAQQWHLDYAGPGYEGVKARTLFVALTPSTLDNCTEFLRFRSLSARKTFEQQLQGAAEGRGCVGLPKAAVEVQPVRMDQFDVAWLETSRTIHRRGPNTSAFVRVTLNVDYSLESEETLGRIGFVDDDMRTAQACPFRTVGPSVVDDLHSEIVVSLE